MSENVGLPVVAVVGRPNVGKSALVNRILGRREAIVEATPGVTRDRHAYVAQWAGRAFEIIDTGGLEPGQKGLEELVAEQALVAVEMADVILFVLDVTAGVLEDDAVVAEILRKADKPVIVAANKADDPRDDPDSSAFYSLGLGDPAPVSALHGRGSGDLLERLVAALPEHGFEPDEAWAGIAIVGRPNVGKSSLLNALLGQSRAIVDSRPGTTRDPVDAEIGLADDRTLRVIDTAGMRRSVKVDDPIEYFSLLRSRRTLERADAAVLVMDVSEGVTGHDQRIAEAIVEAGRACVIVLNKWDLLDLTDADRDRFDRDVKSRLRFLPWARRVRTSAVTGRGLSGVLPAVEAAIESHRRRLSTSLVNRVIADAQSKRPHPRTGGRARQIRYAVQAEVGPPRFLLFSSGSLEDGYLRYIEKTVRAVEPFEGTPIAVEARTRDRPHV
jgi:GTPase